MESYGWRTVIINSRARLSLCNGNLKVEKEDAAETVSLSQIRSLMINTSDVSITGYLINALNENNIKLIFCDEKRQPSCELVGYHNNTSTAGRHLDQISWSESIKSEVWSEIVHDKIMSQYKVLKNNGIPECELLLDIAECVYPENATVQEALAAKLYFAKLFGKNFNRRTISVINDALNYGYSIIMSSVSRAIVLHGYLTSIGVNHCSQRNPFNFSCDIMEPFRAYVDNYVYRNPPEELNWRYKRSLIDLSVSTVIYSEKKMELQTALDMYVNDVLTELSEKSKRKGVLDFYE